MYTCLLSLCGLNAIAICVIFQSHFHFHFHGHSLVVKKGQRHCVYAVLFACSVSCSSQQHHHDCVVSCCCLLWWLLLLFLLITHFAALSAAHTFRVSFNVFACNAAGCHKRTRNHYYFFCLFCFVCLLCLIKRNVPEAAPTVARRCMRNKFKKSKTI